MPAFQKGQDPVSELTQFKKYMEDQIAKAKRSSSLMVQLRCLEDAHAEHFVKMGSLTTIYKGGNQIVDNLKVQIRTLYEEMMNLKDKYNEEIQKQNKSKQDASFNPKFFALGNIKADDSELLDWDEEFSLTW
ncbi:hypothetical protein EP47_07525 [Legionella norrlandica]|uniref:Uncharacterized protein n=1 Tax=Legionella norrlandica TaxID=1498499 RepID=A0A0A2SPP4_9GAMM|nr:hypothetical protein [Legionella norrlandica]KGP63105.1 hypothetical protein EP47_07525 [Legionella norrlandica]